MIFEGRLDYINKRSSDRLVVIEPWAQEFVVKPASVMRVEVACGRAGPFEVVDYDDVLSIWIWSPCMARVFIDGIEHTTPFMGEPFPA